jgi:hypothetical protein
MAGDDLPAPMFNPALTPDWLQAEQKRQLSQALLMQALQPMQAPQTQPVGPYYVQPRLGAGNVIAKLGQALLAGGMQQGALKSQRDYLSALYGDGAGGSQSAGGGAGNALPQQPSSVPDVPGAPMASGWESAPPVSSGLVRSAPTGAAGAPGAPGAASNPILPPGMTPATAQRLIGVMGPEEFSKTFIAPRYTLTDIQRLYQAAGMDPYGPEARAGSRMAIAKQERDLDNLRAGETVFDKANNRAVFTAPTSEGVATNWDANGQPTMSNVPGSTAAIAAENAAKTGGAQSQTPIKLGQDANGRDIYGFPAPPAATSAGVPTAAAPAAPPAGASAPAPRAAAPLNATAPGQTISDAQKQAQTTQATAGTDYGTKLKDAADAATEVRRSLSEIKNLSQQNGPAALNQAKLKAGAVMVAYGIPEQAVSNWLHVDLGALQAASKQNLTLSVALAHSFTARPTNLDLSTFMANNPNLNMADPAALGRVVDYMDSKARQDVARLQDFSNWRKLPENAGHPENWEIDHTARWLQLQNDAINAGKSNSRPPLTSFLKQ